MAKNNNLGDFLAGIANKIRGLLGTTDPINPQDFEDKIQSVYDKGFSEGGPTGITATDADVLAGKVFGSGGNAKSTGTMSDRGQYQYGHFGSGTGYVAINALPEGYYHSDGQSWAPEARISNSDMASGIGLTAAKILKGNTILGVAGSGVGKPALLCSAYFLPREYNGSDKTNQTVSKTVNYYNSAYFNSSGTCVKTGNYTVMRFAVALKEGDAYSAVDIKVGSKAYNTTGVTSSVSIASGNETTCSAIYKGTGTRSDNRVVAVLAIFAEY